MLIEPGRKGSGGYRNTAKKGEKRVRNISQKDVKGQGPKRIKGYLRIWKKNPFHFIYICRIRSTWGLMDPQMLLIDSLFWWIRSIFLGPDGFGPLWDEWIRSDWTRGIRAKGSAT